MILKSARLLFLAALMTFFAAGCSPSDNPDDSTNVDDNNNSDNPDNGDEEGDAVKPEDFLTSTKYKNLVILLAATDTSNAELSSRAIQNFNFFLQQRINKDNIFWRDAGTYVTKADKMSVDDLKSFEKAHRKKVTSGDTVFLWITLVGAESTDNPAPDAVLGKAYTSSSIGIFVKTLNKYTLPDMPSRFTLETYILQHDFCHLLGLVNDGIPMQAPHHDDAHASHCTNTECLMYWEADEDNILLADLLDGTGNGDVLPALDANCLADLKAAGGK